MAGTADLTDARQAGRASGVARTAAAAGRPSSSAPRQHADPAFLAAKRTRLDAPHVAPINELVARIATQTGCLVPQADPDSGGVEARLLIVMESPAGPAAYGSGLTSLDNDDRTASNLWLAFRRSGLPRRDVVIWNAVQWYVGTRTRNATVTAAQVARGRDHLRELVAMLPRLRVVLALGRAAQRSVAGLGTELADRNLVILQAPHPSPVYVAASRGESLREIDTVLADVRRLLSG